MLSRTAVCINQQALSLTNAISQRNMYRTMHLACRIRYTGIKSHNILKISKYSPVLGTCAKRYSSTTEAADTIVNGSTVASTTVASPIVSTETAAVGVNEFSGGNVAEGLTSKLLDAIPDAPVPPTILETITYIGEPPFSSLGLGSWTPPGIVQQCLESMHVTWGLPWWEAIAIGTLALRIMLFPLVVIAQRNGATMSNNMPEVTRLQMEMTEARKEGDQLKAARKGKELMVFMKGKNCNPLKNMIVPMAQAPIFISVFMGLRKMAELPVESMKEGGLWWFTDLTVFDPYYILPLITAATLFVTIEVGTDSARAQSLGMMRYVLRAVPIIVFPFTIHFSSAILCYWTSSNFISLFQVAILRIPKVRNFFKIEPLIKHSKAALSTQKGFVEDFKSSISNIKRTREMNSRYHANEIQFHRAGRGPVEPTFSYDPTKQLLKKPAAIMAKKR